MNGGTAAGFRAGALQHARAGLEASVPPQS